MALTPMQIHMWRLRSGKHTYGRYIFGGTAKDMEVLDGYLALVAGRQSHTRPVIGYLQSQLLVQQDL